MLENQLERIAVALEAIAYYLTAAQGVPEGDAETPAAIDKPRRTRKPKDPPPDPPSAPPATETVGTSTPVEASPAPTIDLPALRARFGAMANAGKRAELLALLDKRGYKVLPDVPPAEYPALWKALDLIEAGQ